MEIKIAPHMLGKSPKYPAREREKNKFFEIVKREIDLLDPFRLLECGAPRDEFDGECAMIADRIDEKTSELGIARVISKVLEEQFDTKFSLEELIPYAARIRTEIAGERAGKKYYFVEFGENGYTYTYEYDGDDVATGDEVVVTVNDGEQKLARVTECRPLPADFDYPTDKIKKIVRKATPEDIMESLNKEY